MIEVIPVALIVLAVTAIASAVLFSTIGEGTALVWVSVVFEAALGIATFAWVRARHRDATGALGLRPARPWREAGLGFLWGLALYVIAAVVFALIFFALLSLITGSDVSVPQQDVLPEGPTSGQLAIQGFAVIVGAPIGEELFFRGLLFGGLRHRFPFWGSALVSAALFAAVHPPPLIMPFLFIVGFGLAWIYERRGSLIGAIAAHAAFNVVGYAFIVSGA